MSEDLRRRMADFYGVDAASLLAVRGAAHGAQLLMRRLALDGAHNVVSEAPVLRKIAAANGLDLATAPGVGTGAIFVVSPDEGTGAVFSAADVARLAARSPDALVVVDESRIDFADGPSLATEAAGRLVVLRSIEAAFGLAGDPCGAVIAAPGLVASLEDLRNIDPVPASVAKRALAALDPRLMPALEERRRRTCAERARMAEALRRVPGISATTGAGPFVFIDLDDMPTALVACRRFAAAATQCGAGRLRLDVGAPEANDRALLALGAAAPIQRRRAEVVRETLETKIVAAVDLDTDGPSAISTGVAFYDHMLAQVAAHGGFALSLHCAGDTDVDAHHSIEDCALAFGAALKQALSERRGVARYGFVLPMDEARAEAAIDLGGRPFLVFDADFAASHIGAYPTEMTRHVFRSIADSLGAAIHLSVKGENDHHKTEACFKAFGRALRQAIRREGETTPSTKGVIL